MTKRFMMMLLLAVETGCPQTWSKGGAIDQAMLKDIIEELRKHHCDPSDVMDACGDKDFDYCMAKCEKGRK
ncbi:MAG: hypothetical protein ACXU86_00865 [Archangium sp.]